MKLDLKYLQYNPHSDITKQLLSVLPFIKPNT